MIYCLSVSVYAWRICSKLIFFCNLILIIFILLFSLRWIRKTIALIVQNEMLAPLIKCTRRKKYNNNNNNIQKLHFISAHFSLFNKFADKRADSTHKTKDLRHKLDHLTPTTRRTMRCAYLWNFCRFPATKPKQKFQFHSQLCHTQRKNRTPKKNDCAMDMLIIGVVFLSPISNTKSMGRKNEIKDHKNKNGKYQLSTCFAQWTIATITMKP